jgi:hypothetical protein
LYQKYIHRRYFAFCSLMYDSKYRDKKEKNKTKRMVYQSLTQPRFCTLICLYFNETKLDTTEIFTDYLSWIMKNGVEFWVLFKELKILTPIFMLRLRILTILFLYLLSKFLTKFFLYEYIGCEILSKHRVKTSFLTKYQLALVALKVLELEVKSERSWHVSDLTLTLTLTMRIYYWKPNNNYIYLQRKEKTHENENSQ